MAETYRSYNFIYGNTMRVQYESELGTVQLALQESGGKVTKTFPQRTPAAPYRRGDTFIIGPELGATFGPQTVEVEECSVSDKVMGSQDGRNTDRIWTVTVTGKILGAAGALEGTSSDVDHPLSYSHNIATKDGKTTRSGSLTLWSLSPDSPYAIGDEFAPIPGGTKITVTDVSIADQIIGKGPDGKLRRIWKIIVSGDEDSVGGPTTVEYTFSRERDDKGIILIRGSMTKTATSESPPPMPEIGDEFYVPYIGKVICTKLDGTQSASESDPPTWSLTAEGAAAVTDDIDMPGEESVEYSANGTITRDVAGEIVALLRSPTPKKVKRIVTYSESEAHPAIPGQLYQGTLCTSKRTTREKVTVDGVTVATYYLHEIEVES